MSDFKIGEVSYELCYKDVTGYPFNRAPCKIVDVGVADKDVVLECEVINYEFSRLRKENADLKDQVRILEENESASLQTIQETDKENERLRGQCDGTGSGRLCSP